MISSEGCLISVLGPPYASDVQTSFGMSEPQFVVSRATLILNAFAAPSFLASLSAGLGGLTVVLYGVGLVRAWKKERLQT